MTQEELINHLNQECHTCQNDYFRKGIPFSPELCKYCKNGWELHNLLLQTSPTEKKWGKIDWTSSKYEDLYKG